MLLSEGDVVASRQIASGDGRALVEEGIRNEDEANVKFGEDSRRDRREVLGTNKAFEATKKNAEQNDYTMVIAQARQMCETDYGKTSDKIRGVGGGGGSLCECL